MLEWFNRLSLKQNFILLLRRFKANDAVIDEIYDNLDNLATAINSIEDSGSSRTINVTYDSEDQYMEFIMTGKQLGYDASDKCLVLSNTSV